MTPGQLEWRMKRLEGDLAGMDPDEKIRRLKRVLEVLGAKVSDTEWGLAMDDAFLSDEGV